LRFFFECGEIPVHLNLSSATCWLVVRRHDTPLGGEIQGVARLSRATYTTDDDTMFSAKYRGGGYRLL
jgi:hypothetical protein